MGIKEIAEQTGTLDLVLILLSRQKLSKSELVATLKPRSAGTTYLAFEILKKHGLLIETKAIDRSHRKDVTLTTKGRKFAEHVQAMEKLVSEDT